MNREKLYFIIIGVLLLISLFFSYSWYFQGSPEAKARIKKLEKDFKLLEEQKKENEKRIAYWENQYELLKQQEDSLRSRISKLEKDAQEAESRANQAKDRFEKIMKELAETRKKIEDFKKNPPNKYGEALLESLKNKIKKNEN